MSAPRAYATATLLLSGRVLVAGGASFGGGGEDLASAELYNPRTGAWSPTGSLTYGREQATATLLHTGQVLIVGGSNGYAGTGTANLYDPSTGTFTSTGGMAVARADHTASLLRDGRVLVTGGCNGTATGCVITYASADVYNPATGTFTPTGNMSSARQYQTATLLPNGKVLIAGGAPCLSCLPLSSAELYDPATDTFTPTASMHFPRAGHTATLLPNGKVLVVGGCTRQDGTCYPVQYTLASAELYNPATGTWTLTGHLHTPRYDHTATLLANGTVLIAGGAGYQAPLNYGQPLSSAEIYNPRTGTFTATAAMAAARDIHTATPLFNGTVLVSGGCPSFAGHCNNPVLDSAEVYTPTLRLR